MSTLHIVNAQYPTHDGVYTCTGTNTISGSARTDSTTITVQVQGKELISRFICTSIINIAAIFFPRSKNFNDRAQFSEYISSKIK